MRYLALRNAWKGEMVRRMGVLSALATLLAVSHAQWVVNDLHSIAVTNQGGNVNYAWRISEATPANNFKPYIVGQAGVGIFGSPAAYRYQLGVDTQGSPSVVVSNAIAYGVNNRGWFVGRFSGAGGRAMVWHPTYGAQQISTPSGRNLYAAFDINDSGAIVGQAISGFFITPAGFVSYFDASTGSTTTHILDQTNGDTAAGTSINDAGTAGGGRALGSTIVSEPVLVPGFSGTAAGWINLTGGPGNYVGAPIVPPGLDLDGDGQVGANEGALIWDISDGAIPQYAAGFIGSDDATTAHPVVFVWNGTGYDIVRLPTPGNAAGRAYGVNNHGHVVGYYFDAQGQRAALWWFTGSGWQMIDLTTLAQASSLWAGWDSLRAALDINNDMCIVGYADTLAGPGQSITSYVMCVVPEPASMVALGSGLVGLLALRRRRKQ